MAGMHKNLRKRYIGLLYICPWIVGFIVFQLYPFVSSFIYSFTDFSMMKAPDFVGLKNYAELFHSSEFYHSLKVTFIVALVSVPGKLSFSLLVALLLNNRLRAIGFFRTIYYLPSILGGSIAVSILWRVLFMREGVVNKVLSLVSIPPQDWLGNPNIALFTISLLTIWQFGSSMVLFLAGLKQIPNELYEASTIDGANAGRKFIHITLPLLSPIILFNLVMQTIGALQDFTAPFVITGGGPVKATYLYALLLYEEAFKFFHMGYASALSWVLFAIILVLTFIIFKTSNQWAYYEDGGEF